MFVKRVSTEIVRCGGYVNTRVDNFMALPIQSTITTKDTIGSKNNNKKNLIKILMRKS